MNRCTSLLVFALLAAACSTSPPPQPLPSCEFTILPEVDGVTVTAPDGVARTTVAGEALSFQLPCAAQSFRFKKLCYGSQEVTLSPDEASTHTLRRQEWEQAGYFRLENGSATSMVEARHLPGGPLAVPTSQHAVRLVPLGEYMIEVAAPFKESVQRQIRVCAPDDIYSLRVETNGPEGDLVTESAQEVVLEHGTGELLVVTEAPNVSFTITPDRSEQLKGYLQKLGTAELAEIDLQEVPLGMRQALALLQRLGAESFRAPTSIVLPAGRYFLEHDLQDEGAERLEVEVLSGESTRVRITGAEGLG